MGSKEALKSFWNLNANLDEEETVRMKWLSKRHISFIGHSMAEIRGVNLESIKPRHEAKFASQMTFASRRFQRDRRISNTTFSQSCVSILDKDRVFIEVPAQRRQNVTVASSSTRAMFSPLNTRSMFLLCNQFNNTGKRNQWLYQFNSIPTRQIRAQISSKLRI